MKIARFALSTVVGILAGLVGGYIPATVVLNMVIASAATLSTVIFFTTAGAIVAMVQRAMNRRSLPRWWALASAAGWTVLIALATVARGTENNGHVALALPASVLFSALVGGALFVRHPDTAEPDAPAPHPPGRLNGFRSGAAAVPAYLVFVGAGHVALAQIMSAQATGPRDGQAFGETLVLGLMFVVLGIFALPVAVARERAGLAILRGALAGAAVALVVVAYTASQGYAMGGVAGELHCIIEQGREICPQGDGTYIAGARPDVFVMIFGAVLAYAVSHVLGRVISPSPMSRLPAA